MTNNVWGLNERSNKSSRFKQLQETQISFLQAPFAEEEIKRAVWNCAEDKASGSDGLTFAFLKAHWDTIKDDFLAYLKEFERSGRVVKGGNTTFLHTLTQS